MGKIKVDSSSSELHSDVDSFYADLRQKLHAEYPSMDLASSELLFNLIRTFNGAQSRLAQMVQRHEITLPGFNVLTLLNYSSSGMPLNELGNLLLVSRANVTGLIDSLERKGFVERTDHRTDRRVFLARITPAGAKLLKVYRPSYLACVKKMAAILSPGEKKALIDLLAKWRGGIDSVETRGSHPTEDL